MRSIVLGLCGILVGLVAGTASADIIYESATMGSSGQPWGHMLLGHTQFGGVRFEVDTNMRVDAIGGHFATYYSGDGHDSLFGALVALSAENDVPDSANLSTPDVLRTVSFDPTNPSSDHVIDIDPVWLSPGWYAVVFGAGLHGSVAGFDNSAQLNNSPVGSPKYLTWTSSGWSFSSSTWPRYTVYGVPEPATLGLLAMGGPALIRRRRRF